MNQKSLDLIIQQIYTGQEQQYEILKSIYELLLRSNPKYDDLITVDELRKRFTVSERTYFREKETGLKAFPFAGKEVLFKSDVITYIENKANLKREKRQQKKLQTKEDLSLSTDSAAEDLVKGGDWSDTGERLKRYWSDTRGTPGNFQLKAFLSFGRAFFMKANLMFNSHKKTSKSFRTPFVNFAHRACLWCFIYQKFLHR